VQENWGTQPSWGVENRCPSPDARRPTPVARRPQDPRHRGLANCESPIANCGRRRRARPSALTTGTPLPSRLVPESTFAHTVRVAATPVAIWSALQDAETWLSLGMMDSVTDSVVRDGRLASFAWTALAAGTRHKGSALTTGCVEGERMVLALDSSELAGELGVTLVPAEGGTAMTVSLTARSRGILAGMFWGVVSDALQQGLVTQVDGFAARF